MESHVRSDHKFEGGDVAALCDQLSDYATRTARQMTSASIRDATVAKFEQAKVAGAISSWRKLRTRVDVRENVVTASMSTVGSMPEMKPYLLDWHRTKASIALGIPQTSSDGPLNWDPSEDYLFPDELARQGLSELLIHWLDQNGMATLM